MPAPRWTRTARTWLSRQRPVEAATPVDEGTAALVTALRLLPEAQRRAIVLHHLGDLSVAEVARVEGSPEGTIKARLSRGRAALGELLADSHEPNGASSHA